MGLFGSSAQKLWILINPTGQLFGVFSSKTKALEAVGHNEDAGVSSTVMEVEIDQFTMGKLIGKA